jgi:hypothetical protein
MFKPRQSPTYSRFPTGAGAMNRARYNESLSAVSNALTAVPGSNHRGRATLAPTKPPAIVPILLLFSILQIL